MATNIPLLTSIDPFPTRALPQERFDATVKTNMDQLENMVDEINDDFIPAVNAISDEVEENKDTAVAKASEAGASATTASTKASEAAASATSASTSATEAGQSKDSAVAAGTLCTSMAESASASATSAASSADAALASENAASASEIAAKASETAAKESEDASASSASAASTSETNAATSASAALASETAAKTSETNAKASETAAKASEDNIGDAEEVCTTKASEASASATAAANSASEAAVSVTNAAVKAAEASTSATNAATSATAASEFATTASTKANEAAESAETATTKASEAASSATTAASEADEASASAVTASNKAQESSEYCSRAETAATTAESLVSKADNAVQLTGDQTIADTKTFSSPIVGDLSGNADTATKATKDANGNVITSTYATKADLESLSKGLVQVFDTLPTTGTEGIIYLVPVSGVSGTFDQYTWENNAYISLRRSDIDLSNYSTLENTVKTLSISGKTITVTKGDGTTETLTTQDTNTLMTQNVSTTNATYPLLLCPTADATANQGEKTGLFAKGVKVNPSTNVISASGFTGPLTGNVTGNVTGDCSGSAGSCTGNAATATTASSCTGNAKTATTLATSRTLWGQSFNGGGNVTGAMTSVGSITFSDVAADATCNLLYTKMAANDLFRIMVGGASNAGYVEIATADDAAEPIYVRQYKGVFTTLTRTATILDGSGNTSFPGTVTATGFSGPLTGNVTGNCSGSSGSCTGNADTATQFSANKSVALTGDVTGSASSKAGWSIATTLASSGVTAGNYGPSANASPAHSGTFSVPYITVDAKGRVTAASTKTITLPASGNTNWTTHLYAGASNGNANAATTNGNTYLIVCDNSTARDRRLIKGTGLVTVTSDANGVITINGATPTNISGSSGSCTGNAATATKATKDSAGNTINTTYKTISSLTSDVTAAITALDTACGF